MAKLDKRRYPWPWRDRLEARLEPRKAGEAPEKVDWKKEFDEERAALEKLIEKSNGLTSGQIVGAVLGFPRGDGCAWYVVTKEKPLVLTWIPYGDAWQVEAALIRGLTKAGILEMLHREKAIAALFSKKTDSPK